MPHGVGELVYHGPNVMLGYATTQAELALGATLDELRTGDVARFHADDGVFEVVARRSRFVKPFGLRIDLDAVEADLRMAGIDAVVAGDDTRLVVCAPDGPIDTVRLRIADLTGLPPAMIHVDTSSIPRTDSGKVAYDEVLSRQPARSEGESGSPAQGELTSVAAIFGAVLGRADVSPNETFVSLGGDSLSYVECSVRLERLLGHVPADWQSMTVAEPRRHEATPEPGAARHVGRAADGRGPCRGGDAHEAVVLPRRFAPDARRRRLQHQPLPAVDRRHARRVVAGFRLIGRVALPVAAWVGVCMVAVGGYGLPTLTLLNNYLGAGTHVDGRWHYWFIEALVQLVLIVTLALAIGPVRRFERRFQYLFPLLLFGAALVLRSHWVDRRRG